jgi:hypothetical protein
MMSTTVVSNRYPHKLAIVTLVIGTKPGDTITRDQLDAATKAPRVVWQHALSGAKKELRRQHGIVFERDPQTGEYRHTRAADRPELADRRAARARRAVMEGREIMHSISDVDFGALSPGEQSAVVQTRAKLDLFADLMTPAAVRSRAVVSNGKEKPMLPK